MTQAVLNAALEKIEHAVEHVVLSNCLNLTAAHTDAILILHGASIQLARQGARYVR